MDSVIIIEYSASDYDYFHQQTLLVVVNTPENQEKYNLDAINMLEAALANLTKRLKEIGNDYYQGLTQQNQQERLEQMTKRKEYAYKEYAPTGYEDLFNAMCEDGLEAYSTDRKDGWSLNSFTMDVFK